MNLWRRKSAGALVIDEARYGRDGYKWVDVTDVVRQMVMGGRLSMSATHAELGIDDPAEHVVKQLEIKYRLDVGPQKTFRCTEGSEMALP
jgi:hypothetical protein